MIIRTYGPLVALLLLGAVAAPTSLHAQHLGVTVTRTSSKIRTGFGDGTALSSQNRDAFGGGLTYRKALRSRLALQPELLWVGKGTGSPGSPERSLGYLELPVLLRFGALAPTGSRFSPIFSIGPTVAVLVSCRLKAPPLTNGQQCDEPLASTNLEYKVRRVDAGAMLGFGVEARTRSGSIVGLEGRYEIGLLDSEPDAGTSRNTTAYLMLHWVPANWF